VQFILQDCCQGPRHCPLGDARETTVDSAYKRLPNYCIQRLPSGTPGFQVDETFKGEKGAAYSELGDLMRGGEDSFRDMLAGFLRGTEGPNGSATWKRVQTLAAKLEAIPGMISLLSPRKTLAILAAGTCVKLHVFCVSSSGWNGCACTHYFCAEAALLFLQRRSYRPCGRLSSTEMVPEPCSHTQN
jgi:hypothetical protein